MKQVFLGGTCNNSQWRGQLIPLLKINYFNPVVEDWTPECYERELYEREVSDYCLYIITPKMTGVYSIAEVVEDAIKRPGKTIFCVLHEDGTDSFEAFQVKSLNAVGKMVEKNGAKWLHSLQEVADYVNP